VIMTKDRRLGRIGMRHDLIFDFGEIVFMPKVKSTTDKKLYQIYRQDGLTAEMIEWLEKKMSGSSFLKFKPERIFLIYKIIIAKDSESLTDIAGDRMKIYIMKNIFNPKVINTLIRIWKKLKIAYGKMIGEIKYMLTYCKRQSLLDQLNKYTFDQDFEFLVYDKEKCSILAKKLANMHI